MREIFLGLLGLCMGTTIASGVVAFIISLGIVPRFAGITGSAAQVRLYEESGKFIAIYQWKEKEKKYHIVKMFFNE